MNPSNQPLLKRLLGKLKSVSNHNTISVNHVDFEKTHCHTLKVNLKQLEFISCFEMHLDVNKEESYSLSFLEELAQIKEIAQKNTMKSIEFCKS